MFNTVRNLVSMLPDSHRLLLHRVVALPLIQFGGSFLAGGILTYEPRTEERHVAGFRPDRFAGDG